MNQQNVSFKNNGKAVKKKNENKYKNQKMIDFIWEKTNNTLSLEYYKSDLLEKKNTE